MKFFLTLQPVFKKDKQVYAYQVYHNSQDEKLDVDVCKFTLDSIQSMGLERFSRSKPTFLNFTESLIRREVPSIMSPSKIIVDVLQPKEVDDELISHFTNLKSQNYTLCFGEYIFKTEYRDLLKFADIVKVNFGDVDVEKNQVLVEYCNRNKKHVLAQKLEYNANFEYAKYLGCKFFEGGFFSKPEIIEVQDIAPMKFNYLQLINSVARSNVDFEEISNIVAKDVSLSYKLLRLVNSVAFGFRARIESIKHAAVILGEKELKKWVSYLVINEVADDKPNELARLSLFRGKFAELLVKTTNLKPKSDEVFMMGLFSMLDVIIGRPLKELLEGLHLPDEVFKVLIARDGPYENLYSFILAYEACDWEEVDRMMLEMNWDENYVIEVYLKANGWCNELLEETFSTIN
jgi:EAL and modified HD-GYP domain-containing signal transduction protein